MGEQLVSLGVEHGREVGVALAAAQVGDVGLYDLAQASWMESSLQDVVGYLGRTVLSDGIIGSLALMRAYDAVFAHDALYALAVHDDALSARKLAFDEARALLEPMR